MFKVESPFRAYQPKPVEKKPVVQPQTQTQNSGAADSRRADVQFFGVTNKVKLERQFAAAQPSPQKALDEINNLPPPDPTDKAAVTEYKAERRRIADDAIRNSPPPRIEDFRNSGLNGRTAEYEYRDARQSYDTQIRELETISADAERYPDEILTPYEATQEINALPRPDRDNPQSVADYNDRRAAIADSALLYATPPNREDYLNSGLNGATANYEYQQALSDYQTNVAQLREDSSAGGTSVLPTMTDAEAERAATEYINARGGVNNEDDAYGVGQDVAALAETDPEGAALVMQKVQGKLSCTDYGDNVASGFVDSASVEELRRFSQTNGGEAVLRDLQNRLTTGDVHEGERAQSDKIDEAITGLNPQSLTGDPERDAQTVDEQLKNLPPEMRDDYIQAVLEHPFGGEAIKYAAVMSPEGQEALGKALGDLYAKDPTGTIAALREITDGSPDATVYPWSYQSGLATAVGKSGSDGLIKEFAQNEINRAKANPEESNGYINAVAAYAGLSPEGLQDVMANNPDFFHAASEAGRLSADYTGVIESGYGELLKKAAQATDAEGKPTAEAMRLFKEAMPLAGANTYTKEGLGEFFLAHQDAIINSYVGGNGYDLTSDGLKSLNSFFKNVLFTTPLGANAKEVATAYTARLNETLTDADRLSDAEFEGKYHRNKHDMTSLVGEQYGTLVNALEESLKSIKDRTDAEAEQLVDVLNGVISVGAAAGSLAGPAATVGTAILGEGLKLALGAAGDDIAQGRYDEAVKKLKDGGIDLDQFSDYAVNDVLARIENRTAHDSFRDAFGHVKEVLE